MSDKSNADSVARILAANAIDGGNIQQDEVAKVQVGGIPVGTAYPEGTPLAQIIHDMLNGVTPIILGTYQGATDEKPTSIAGLTKVDVPLSEFVSGYHVNIKAGNPTTMAAQYVVFAIPDTHEITKWAVDGFDYNLPHSVEAVSGYNIYYLNTPSYDRDIGGVDYVIKI